MIEGLVINQEEKRFEYFHNNDLIDVDGTLITKEKLIVREIIEGAIKNWNLNNPKFPIRCVDQIPKLILVNH